ncbi:MAG: hypothetical protein H0T56_03970 [Pseudaminobacter sp.]|nr:hypothetical protein [Pseudaminobacter sp.]
MKSRVKAAIVCALAALACLSGISASKAQQRYAWRLGESSGLVTASMFSINTLSRGSSRVIDYHPVFIIGCKPDGEPRWTQTVQLKDPVSGDRFIDLAITVDGKRFSERWALGFQDRGFSRNGNEAVARLLRARRLKIVWRIGFLAGNGQADFSLAGIDEAVRGIAESCGIDPP